MDVLNTDIINIFCLISSAIAIYLVIDTIIKAKRAKEKTKNAEFKRIQSTDEYEEILRITQDLETNREKNKGEHLEESVYLERANLIRTKSPFFSWIK